ncbi:MAG: hypothetical protein HN356_02500 [Calditrichaeota bacterium]|jgi:hypothetical protein|nr:hypothetical protein [Calditrichota bacterium]MBT7788023.1 hypothetical protein [Calditrichota bacterium]
MRKLIYILVAITATLTLIFAQSISNRNYWPGCWDREENSGNYKLGYWLPDSFNVKWVVYSPYPLIGYPYHSGNAVGINDTAKVRVYFDNRTDTDYALGSATPETWFIPELYDPYVDVFTASPIADTSVFDYRFEHWIAMSNNEIRSKPDTLYTLETLKLGRGGRYGLIYSLWGVSPGKYRVILKPTAYKPSDIHLCLSTPYNCFTISKGQHLLDTLNSYSNNAYNAFYRHEYTLFNTYVDSILDRNSRSIIGWALDYHGHAAQTDTTNALIALDSLLNILDNNLDTLVADSSERTSVQWRWLKQWGVDYKYFQRRMEDPEKWRNFIPM